MVESISKKLAIAGLPTGIPSIVAKNTKFG